MLQSKAKHILVVEDYDPVRELTAAVLEDRGYRVSTVVSGASMRQFVNADSEVDAIVLDVHTPGESGATLARYADELGLPVVMVSGNPDVIEFAAANDLQLLQKPYRTEDLYAALDKALGSGEFGQRSESGAEKESGFSQILPGQSVRTGNAEMAISEAHARMFADAIRLADDWFVEGGDRHGDQKEPRIIAACEALDGSSGRMPHAILRALRELAFKLNDVMPPDGATYRDGAKCLRDIVGKLPRHSKRPPPPSYLRS
jgi:CheY-like chemotaxis protein